jgi:RND family efflux transporter MFP subunit
MSAEAGTDATDRIAALPGAGGYAVLDQVLWNQLRKAESAEAFALAWLALQCRLIEGATGGVVVLGEPDVGPFAPAAIWPDESVTKPELTNAAEQAIKQRQGVVAAAGGGRCFAVPLVIDGRLHGVCALAISTATVPSPVVMRQLQWGSAWIEVLLRRDESASNAEQRERSSAVLDLLATVLEHRRLDEAATAFVTELALRLECDPVSVGFVKRRRCRVFAVSHSAGFGNRMDLIRDIGNAMDEAVDQRAIVLYPANETWEYRVTRAHADLAAAHKTGAILTIPLQAGGEIIGAITLERLHGRTFDESTVDLCDAVAAVIGPVLAEKRANDRLLVFKVAESILTQAKRLLGPQYFGRKLAIAASVALVAFFSFAQSDYSVTSPAIVEGRIQRTLVAPFNGYIGAEHVRAGAVVKSGQLLATLDDQDLTLERMRWSTTRRQRVTEYDRALAKGERAEANIARSQVDQANAQLALLDEQLSRTKITAPFDGVVVSGDLSQKIGGAVERGQELFKIAPLNAYRVTLEIHESDIQNVREGQGGTLVLASLPDLPLRYHIERITPTSEQAEGRNFFRAEAVIEGANERLRPSMAGIAKTDIDRRLLIRIWTEKMIDWIQLAAWRWMP